MKSPYKNPINKVEAKFQTKCVLWYRNIWYQNLHNLFAVFNEGIDVNTKNSMGMVPGVSDLLYYESWKRGLLGLECKSPGMSHSVAKLIRQAKWIIDVCDGGGFFDDYEQFQRIIKGENCWIDPKKVLAFCEHTNKKTIIWNREIFK